MSSYDELSLKHDFVDTSASETESDSEQVRKPVERKMPAWAMAAAKKDSRAQPWKKHITQKNDPNFAEGVDLSLFYKEGMTLCAGEGSLAA